MQRCAISSGYGICALEKNNVMPLNRTMSMNEKPEVPKSLVLVAVTAASAR
jgi:dTDP-glucose pyrophosphorylase